MLTALHTLHSIVLGTGSTITQLNQTDAPWNMEELQGHSAGHTQPLFVGAMAGKPEVNFTSSQIKTILDATGLEGADQSAGNTDLYLRAATNLGTREAAITAAHIRLRAAGANLHWTEITARQKQVAEIRCKLMLASADGSTSPLIPAGSLALAGTSQAAEQFTLGPISINGSTLAGVQQWRLRLELEYFEEWAEGETWPTFVGIKQIRAAMLEVLTRNPAVLATYAPGTAVTAAVAHLRKKALDGFNVANGTLEHISLTATDGIVLIDNGSGGGGNEPFDANLRLAFRAADATSDVLAIDTTAAIA